MEVALAVYLVITIVFMVMFLRKGSNEVGDSIGYMFFAVGASILWPLTIALFIFDKD